MKHTIYLLAILFTLTACNNGLEEQETAVITESINESEWIKYESGQYDFSFTYPPDWILEEDGNTVRIHSLEKDLYLYSEYLDIEIVSSTFDDLKSEIENSDRLEDGTSLAQFSEATEVNINGATSLKGEHATAIGTPVVFYYIPLEGNGLWITRYSGFDASEERIISTFTLENDNEETPADGSKPPSESNEILEDQTSGVEDWESYRNEKYGFTFKYPTEFTLKDGEDLSDKNYQSHILFSGLDLRSKNDANKVIFIQIFQNNQSLDLEAYIRDDMYNPEMNDHFNDPKYKDLITIGWSQNESDIMKTWYQGLAQNRGGWESITYLQNKTKPEEIFRILFNSSDGISEEAAMKEYQAFIEVISTLQFTE